MIYADKDHDHRIRKFYEALKPCFEYKELVNLADVRLHYVYSVEDLFKNRVTLFGEKLEGSQYPELFYPFLIRYLMEVLTGRAPKDAFLMLIPPKDDIPHYDLFSRILDLRVPVPILMVTDQHIEGHEILKRVGIRFMITDSNAYVWLRGKGPALITLDEVEVRKAKIMYGRGEGIPPGCPYSLITVLSPVFKYIDEDYGLRSMILYTIYKRGNKKLTLSKLPNVIAREIPEVEKSTINTCLQVLARDGLIRINEDETVEYNEGFEKWFSSAIPSAKGKELVREIVDYYFSRGYCVVPAKQWLGIQRPDLIAIPFNPENKRLRYNQSIAIEVEAHLDKGQNTIEQAKKNMIKNTDFRETHVWTFPEYRDTITKIYNELTDDEKRKVKIFFFGEEIFKLKEEVKVEKTEKKKRQQKEVKVISKDLQTLDTFFEQGKEKESSDSEGIKVEEKVVETDVIKKEDEKREEVVEIKDDVVRIVWNGRAYELEKTEKLEMVKDVVDDIIKGKLSIVVEDNFLRIVDEKGITLIKARILRVD